MTDEEIEQTKYFFSHVYNEDGSLNEEKVLAELSDYLRTMENASEVYYAITGGVLSKPNYTASAVLGVHEEFIETLIRESVSEVLDRHSDGESLSNLRREFNIDD